ncbi:MAG: hypothetical protein KBG28_11475 [Kofleriaceae bacterium]|nr:hypothetical protein [Kofleriaceae bacterium]
MSVLAVSPDGRWAALASAGRLSLHDLTADGGVASVVVGADLELALVEAAAGAPVLVVVERRPGDGATTLTARALPGLDELARLELADAHELAGVVGPRLAVLRRADRRLLLIRVASRAFMPHPGDLGAGIEFALGLERGQLLVGTSKKVEILDPASGRPTARVGLPLPAAPRQLGAAAGHLWCVRVGRDEITSFRLSDGRPWVQLLGSPITTVASNPGTPTVVVATAQGAFRLHCLTRSASALTVPAASALALAVRDGQVEVIGVDPAGALWRAPLVQVGPAPSGDHPVTAPTARPAANRDGAAAPSVVEPRAGEDDPSWRDGLVAWAAEIERGGNERDLPVVPAATRLARLADSVPAGPARRLLFALYGSYLQGQPRLALARAARVGGDGGWREALGAALAAAGAVRVVDGTVELAPAVARFLDGAGAQALVLVGERPGPTVLTGVHRVQVDDLATAPQQLAAGLGRVGWVTGDLEAALREASVHGVTAAIDLDGWRRAGGAHGPAPYRSGLVVVHVGPPGPELAGLTRWDGPAEPAGGAS